MLATTTTTTTAAAAAAAATTTATKLSFVLVRGPAVCFFQSLTKAERFILIAAVTSSLCTSQNRTSSSLRVVNNKYYFILTIPIYNRLRFTSDQWWVYPLMQLITVTSLVLLLLHFCIDKFNIYAYNAVFEFGIFSDLFRQFRSDVSFSFSSSSSPITASVQVCPFHKSFSL